MNKIYFLGIGGIGMSGLARYFLNLGKSVFGYDKTPTVLTHALEAEGAIIHYTDDIQQIPEGIDLVIYTPAIPKDMKERVFLETQTHIPMLKRAQVLGEISKKSRCVAVAGTHGKTTTSTIITHLLRTGGIDCSAFLGGISANLNSNFVAGKSDWVVVEADEFDRSFLQLFPEIGVLTAMDADHLDIYGTAEEVVSTYQRFATQVNGTLIHKSGLAVSEKSPMAALVGYNILDNASTRPDAYIHNIRKKAHNSLFDYSYKGIELKDLEFSQHGTHNCENACAAITVSLELGLSEAQIRAGLSTFKGIQRRFEYIIQSDNQVFVDDYAHHPEELNAAIGAMRDLYPNAEILGVFQPHLYTRTRDFVDGFAEALDKLDEIILLDIYPARELPIEGVDSSIIFNKMQNPRKTLIQKSELLPLLAQRRPRHLLTVGAGDIGAMIGEIKNVFNSPI